MSRWLPIGILGLWCGCGFFPLSVAADEPWDATPFSAPAADIRRAADGLGKPKDADVDVLLEEVHYTFDLQGRWQTSTRQVMRFLTPKGVNESASIEGLWSPWCEDRPLLRALVIAADGAVHELDPRSIGEAPVEQSPNVWSDRKTLRAPLPAVRPGCVTETEVVLRETQPMFAQGVVKHFVLSPFYPIRKLRLIVDFPAQLPLRYEVRGTDLKPVRTEKNGQVRLVFEPRSVKPLKFEDMEFMGPPEMPLFPQVVFSTGKSWKDVAAGYEILVERQMDLDAVKTIAREAVGAAPSREQAAARLLAKVQQLIRYTGVEFGNAAIVPRPPKETLARRYGDCKDQATLLVAMLRAAGFGAHVALIQAGGRGAMNKDLPGLGGFNHAIVSVDGSPALWLDPTNNYVPAGQLPASDQGCWALVASRSAEGLVKTPVADYRQNRCARRVDYFLNDGPSCRVRETFEAEGPCGAEMRAYVASQNEEDLRKSWQDYVVGRYFAKTLLSFEHSAPQDLARPFRIVAEAADSKLVTVGDDKLGASIFPGIVFQNLPATLLPEVQETAEGTPSTAPPRKDRKAPLLLPEPRIDELVFQVTPPPGFMPGPLPANELKHFGPMAFSRQFGVIGDVVTATFRLDTGPGKLTAAEVNAIRRDLAEVGPKGDLSRRIVPVEFDYRGAKEFREGRWKDAFDEYRRLAGQYSDRPGPRWHYIDALLKAGFGEVARQASRQAADMEPKSAEARARPGCVLCYDLLGRYLQPGMDRPAALAAFRKAIELDPTDANIHVELAILLEYDDAGRRYSSDADLAAAIAEYREARKLPGGLGACEVNPPLDMLLLGDYAGAEKYCRQSPAFPWKGLIVASEAALNGLEAAGRKLERITQSAEERRMVLIHASDHLNRGRNYPLCTALLRMALSKESEEPALKNLVEILSKLRRIEEVQLPTTDPRCVVQQALVAALAEGKWEQRCLNLFTATSSAADKAAIFASVRTTLSELLRAGQLNNFPPQRTADAVSGFEIAVAGGDDAGRRVQATHPKIPGMNLVWFVVREPQGYRILAPGAGAGNLGAEALRQLEAKHTETAIRWLDWAWKDKPRPGMFDAFSASPFSQLWMWADRSRTENVRLAAAALAAEGADPAAVVPILVAARKKADKASDRLQIDRALAHACCSLGRWTEVSEAVDRLPQGSLDQSGVAALKMTALDNMNRQEELHRLAQTQLQKLASRPDEQETLARMACETGAFGLAREILGRRARQSKISAAGLNELAFGAALQDPPDVAAMKDALEADRRGDRVAMLYPITRALLLAEQGETKEARENFTRSLENRIAPPGDVEWYVLGRIAEGCGLGEVAAGVYAKVPPSHMPGPRTFYALAQRRLQKQGRGGCAMNPENDDSIPPDEAPAAEAAIDGSDTLRPRLGIIHFPAWITLAAA